MNSSSNKPLLFVDGYNIIGAWPQLSRMRDSESLDVARHRLVEDLTNYSAYQGFKTRIVFDAYTRKQRGVEEAVTNDVSVHYTPFGQTADTYIEKWCAELQRQVKYLDLRLIVATSDHAHRLTVTGYGAEWMSAHRLAVDVEDTVRQGREHSRSKRSRSKSKRSNTVLKPAVQDRLRSEMAKILS